MEVLAILFNGQCRSSANILGFADDKRFCTAVGNFYVVSLGIIGGLVHIKISYILLCSPLQVSATVNGTAWNSAICLFASVENMACARGLSSCTQRDNIWFYLRR